MKLSRSSRLVAAFIALVSMLFMQLALAGYACPSLKISYLNEPVTMPSDDGNRMPGCEGMDKEQPSLCHAHDQAGNQSLDKPELPYVQPFIATALMLVLHDIEVAYSPSAIQPDSLLLTRTVAPPLSIRNCCFQI
jgi:NADH:ubiquinone oxidoreductase subunit 3 (subunit A)